MNQANLNIRSGGRDDIEPLAKLLHACVHAGASVSFILPFTVSEAEHFWRTRVIPDVEASTSRLLVACIDTQVVGVVQLDMATPPNQRHRAEVRKLLVHPEARRMGIARKLMIAIEDSARQEGRWLLTLDTRTGDSAEPLYASLGYVRVGVIPNFARRFDSDSLDATTIMYKELSKI